MRTDKADLGYTLAGFALAVVGLIAGDMLWDEAGTYRPDEANVSVFALVYVLAQGVERIVEVVLAFVGAAARLLQKELATTTKARALQEADDRQADSAEADTRALAFGLALGVAFTGCGYFGVEMLELIGVQGAKQDVELFVTGLVVAGGSKPLHDLISKIQKSKQKDEKQPTSAA